MISRVVLLLFIAGCPPGKPVVELPPPSGALRATLLPSPLDGPRDIRVLRVAGDRLYAGDVRGLVIYSIANPATPVEVGRIDGTTVDDLAVLGSVVILMEIDANARLRSFDVTDATNPTPIASPPGGTLTFGGIAARPGLVWHAVGSNPPSKLYRDPSLDSACSAPDRERGAMGIWLDERFAFESLHFDDYAGDGLDGNGAFGFAVFRVEVMPTGCPRLERTDIYFADTHDSNRSAFERPSASDLQLALLGDELFATGEQRLQRLFVDANGRLHPRDAVAIPEALSPAIDAAGPCGPVVGVANGDVVLTCSEGELSIAAAVTTPGVTREIAAAGDGRHFFIGDDELGLAVISYEVP